MKYTQYKLARLDAYHAHDSQFQMQNVCDVVNQKMLASGLGIHFEADSVSMQIKAQGEAYEAYLGLSEYYQGLTRVVCETGEFTV